MSITKTLRPGRGKVARACAALALAWLALPAAQAATITYFTTLSGAAEAPPNASPASGWARVTIDQALERMRVEAAFQDLLGPATVAHIHCCTAVPGAGNVGVATPTPSFPGFPAGAFSGSYDVEFDMTMASSFNGSFITNNGGTPATAFLALVAGMNEGRAYFNLHTQSFPGGEIRGFLQVQRVPEPLSGTLAALALLLAAGAGRRRAAD